ncbi:flagellar filament capping protein FliD [Scleromatobacter humisilvae]|uniref:Flagellar hook-associated protein 2 n=1 Tax=Scleromatobacter humisilvae TaxID=2897159 RepID=A0A9X1YH17_9BURK|nr:flagellar filament capping protein FliD [Scleromatobacter humisilvae]MCK9684700.1 flagellar filament capping protein FliD [Scleromatobacter humisilvae]
MTTTPSSTTGSISSAGLGSGLDVKSIISSLMAVESQPLQLLQDKANTVQTEISAVGQIQSLTSTLSDKAHALSNSSLWTQTTSSTSDSTVVTADTSGGTAAAGDYSVSVQQLAQGQTATLATAATALTPGTITIQLGTYSTDSATPPNTSFLASGAAAPPITIGPGDTSLASIRDKINQANAGVSASIITDASGSRLSLRSTTTGAANGFQITATPAGTDPDPTSSLAALNFDASTGAVGSQMALNQFAQNAKATVNGIAVSSATNKLSNISDGLSLTLLKKTDTPADVTVSSDTASMQKAITDFVSAYSAVQSYISLETKYDAGTAVQPGTSRQDSPLTGDPSVIGFQNQLRAIVNTTSTTSSMFARLSDIGIAVQTDGTLAVASSTKLTSALQHPDELSKLFTTYGTTNENTGIAVRFGALADNAVGVNGTLYSRASGLRGELSRNQQQQDDMQTHLDATQARLTAQYQALDTTMSQMSALSSYVSQQVSLMEK